MANKKISDMEESTSINGDDYFTILQGGSNKKIKMRNAVTNELYYKSGDTYSTGSTYGAGVGAFLTTGRTQISFDIILPKRINNISEIIVNALAIRVRHGAGGYLLTNDTSAYANVITNKDSQGNDLEVNCTNITAQKISDCQIRIALVFDGEIHETNNIPIAVEYRNINLSFS